MAKGKRTYVAYYSTETGNMVHKVTRKHEVLKMKEIKKG